MKYSRPTQTEERPRAVDGSIPLVPSTRLPHRSFNSTAHMVTSCFNTFPFFFMFNVFPKETKPYQRDSYLFACFQSPVPCILEKSASKCKYLQSVVNELDVRGYRRGLLLREGHLWMHIASVCRRGY